MTKENRDYDGVFTNNYNMSDKTNKGRIVMNSKELI